MRSAHSRDGDRRSGRGFLLARWTAAQCLLLVVFAGATLRVPGQTPAPAAAKGAVPPVDRGLNTPLPQSNGAARQPADSALDTTGVAGGTDTAMAGSPVSPERTGVTIAIGTTLSVELTRSVDSGSVRNGDVIQAVLTAPVRTSSGRTLGAGTPVEGTVVSAARAGTVQSGGVLSLQLTRVGGISVVTDVDDFNGREGHKDIADAAPAKGEEAQVPAGTTLEFHVMEDGAVPGLVPVSSVTDINGGPTVGSPAAGAGAGGGQPGQPAAGQANTQPGANQTPVGGATQGVRPANVPGAPTASRPK